MITLLVDPQAPERLRLRISNQSGASELLDLTDVTAVVLKVRHPALGDVVWDADILTQEANLLLLEHVWALGEASHVGEYLLSVDLIVPTGIRRTGPTPFAIVRP